MRENRFFGNFDFSKKEIIIDDAETCRQLSVVLRVKKGDKITLCNNNKRCFGAVIQTIQKRDITCILEEEIKNNELDHTIGLNCAILKKENFEWVVQKATELGVSQITPIITQRTVKLNIDKKRLEKITKEAAEQSGHSRIPAVEKTETFKKALEKKTKNTKILCDMSGVSIKKEDIQGNSELFIGPEGGWSQEEIEMAKKEGCLVRSFSSFTLRAETAAIVATYQIVSFTIK